MRKIYFLLALALTFSFQSVFADNASMSASPSQESKPCMDVAKACISAGYTRQADPSKKFWKDCMKPTLMGKTVTGVTVAADTVKACRAEKIDRMKKELNELVGTSTK